MIFKRGDSWAYRPLILDGKTSHFRPFEFICRCGVCSDQKLDVELIKKLDILREKIKKPINISSGYRCPRHNENVFGKNNSAHLQGWAADIISKGVNGVTLYHAAKDIFECIGVGKDFIHVDIRKGHRLWFYDNLSEKDLII
jgi:hypothetical protein